jgi:hypothetical protein
MVPTPDILQFFTYKHLETPAQRISAQFCDVAHWVVANVPDCAERSVALRKLLEGKDAAVRAHFCDVPNDSSARAPVKDAVTDAVTDAESA